MSTTPTLRTTSFAASFNTASALTSTAAWRLAAAALAVGATLSLLAGVAQIAEIQARNAAVEVMSAQGGVAPAQAMLASPKPSTRA